MRLAHVSQVPLARGYCRLRLGVSSRSGLDYSHVSQHVALARYTYGKIPAGMEPDHLDGNPSNNVSANIRLLTIRENRGLSAKRWWKKTTSGAVPENVNYALKSSFLLSFLESVPELVDRLKPPATAPKPVQQVAAELGKATALVIAYWSASARRDVIPTNAVRRLLGGHSPSPFFFAVSLPGRGHPGSDRRDRGGPFAVASG